MTTTPVARSTTMAQHSSVAYAVRDVVTLARRNLLALIRVPTALVFMVIQPVMFVLLFRYIFQRVGCLHARQLRELPRAGDPGADDDLRCRRHRHRVGRRPAARSHRTVQSAADGTHGGPRRSNARRHGTQRHRARSSSPASASWSAFVHTVASSPTSPPAW